MGEWASEYVGKLVGRQAVGRANRWAGKLVGGQAGGCVGGRAGV